MTAIKMTPTEAIALVHEKTQGQTFHEGSWGLLTAAAVLAGEVERLRCATPLQFAAQDQNRPNQCKPLAQLAEEVCPHRETSKSRNVWLDGWKYCEMAHGIKDRP